MSSGSFILPNLPFAYDALEPYIDAKTMEIHYTKHHQAYVTNLNKAVEEFNIEQKDLLGLLVEHSDKTAVRNNGGGHFNHTFFWQMIAPGGAKEPSDLLAKAIVKGFGSMDSFKEQFSKFAMARFGSGWAWLICKENLELEIISTANQDVPFLSKTGGVDGSIPLLGIDVWEHAYYLKYQNRRADYITGFFNIINWTFASNTYQAAVG
jgi:Fe-Mn family superoxide dismutase